ncbi:hypothetical protein G6K64_004721, partial [Salmonella enterica subsp. enterica serovar Rubislaw]|nr:hypothetical protein [Salmonella enterica subsp. enterica serovar Rubislaw]
GGNGADFTGLDGADVSNLANIGLTYSVKDIYAGVDVEPQRLPTIIMVYYGELYTHLGAANLGSGEDLFRTDEAASYCARHKRNMWRDGNDAPAATVIDGVATGGSVPGVGITAYIGGIGNEIKGGGDTNPELFVSGMTRTVNLQREYRDGSTEFGTRIPTMMVLVNGSRSAAIGFDTREPGAVDSNGTYVRIGT